jgi:hypothetical protein
MAYIAYALICPWVLTAVSEELSASIIRVIKQYLLDYTDLYLRRQPSSYSSP